MYKALMAIGFVTSLLASTAGADDGASPPPVDLKRVCEEIVNLVSRGESKGFAVLRQQEVAPAPDDEWSAAVQDCERELRAFEEKFGTFLGNELVDERNIKDTFRRYTYVAKYERNTFIWTFTFYRPKDKWKLHSWNFTQNLDLLFRTITSSDSK